MTLSCPKVGRGWYCTRAASGRKHMYKEETAEHEDGAQARTRIRSEFAVSCGRPALSCLLCPWLFTGVATDQHRLTYRRFRLGSARRNNSRLYMRSFSIRSTVRAVA